VAQVVLRNVKETGDAMKRGNDPRSDYIAVATSAFAAHGFHGVSLAALAKEAGVTKQALLHFFGTKERLYGDVLTALANRLCAEIEDAASPDPAQHLRAYFLHLSHAARSDARDARLVVRALLDSDAAARHWPLRPYLDRLIALIQSVPGRAETPSETALAWSYQIIGAVQYLAISAPTVAGIYGADTEATLQNEMERFVSARIDAIVQSDPKDI
jgi:AcrR family transcriptional regulator